MSKENDKYSYFKVSDKLLDTELKKSEFWVYLTHCRCRGIKTKGYSIAGLKRTRELFGNKINEKVYNKAIKSLIEKDLIIEVDAKEEGINTAFYKTDTAIRIVEGDSSVQIPMVLLDDKIINDMTVEEIKTVIEIYSHYKPQVLGSIDDSFIRAYSTHDDKGYYEISKMFGNGFNRSILSKKAIQVSEYDEIETEIDIFILEKLIELQLFNFKPVVIEVDKEDDSLYELKYEIFKELVSFEGEIKEVRKDRYVIAELEENKEIIWILEPLHHMDIEPYRKYLENKEKAYRRSLMLYKERDVLTDRKQTRYSLYWENTYELLEILLDHEKLIKVYELKDELESFTQDCNSLEIEVLERKLKSLYAREQEEIKSIKEKNKRIKEEEGKISRLKTSPTLKLIRHDIVETKADIDHIELIESKLLDLIPPKAFIPFFTASEGYEVENEGRVSRIVG